MLPMRVLNFQTYPIKYLRNVVSRVPPLPPMKIWSGLGTSGLRWSRVFPQMKIWSGLGTWDLSCPEYTPTPPPRLEMKTWPDWGTLDLSWSRVPPLPSPKNLSRLRDFGFELVQSIPYTPQHTHKWKFGQDSGFELVPMIYITRSSCQQLLAIIPRRFH